MDTELRKAVVRRGIKIGLIVGAASVYVAAIGLVQRFDEREFITDVISLGYVLYVILGLSAGYLAAGLKRGIEGDEPIGTQASIAVGAIAGFVSGIVMTPFLFAIDAFTVRDTFVNISQRLFEILSLGRGVGFAVLFYTLGGALIGALGAAFRLVSPSGRRLVVTGATAVAFMSLMEPLIRVMLSDINKKVFLKINLDIPPDWIYKGGGLTIVGTVVVFAAAVAVVIRQKQRAERARVKAEEGGPPPERSVRAKRVSLGLILLVLLLLPQVVGKFPSEILGVVGIFVLLGIGLNVVVGYAGMLDLGYVAFFAIGAYSMGILTSPASPLFSPELSFWAALPIVIVITTIGGILIGAPVLRLRGDYLAIVTLGFGEIIRVIVQSDWASPMLGGAQGLLRVPKPSFFGTDLGTPDKLYYLILACVLLVAFIAYRVKSSRVGRAWNAMREDESVAEAMGISIIKTKLLAFGTGAALASFGGAIFAAKIGSLFPGTFLLIVSINVLAIIVLGGMGSIPGVVVGAFVLVGIPEVLREFGEYRLLFYGAILMALMILKPEGLLPDLRRQEELHEAELDEEQALLAAAAISGRPS
jgi:branched-chain amino acid transport system permease protein